MPDAERSTVSAEPQSALMRPIASAPLSQSGMSEASESQPRNGLRILQIEKRQAGDDDAEPDEAGRGEPGRETGGLAVAGGEGSGKHVGTHHVSDAHEQHHPAPVPRAEISPEGHGISAARAAGRSPRSHKAAAVKPPIRSTA